MFKNVLYFYVSPLNLFCNLFVKNCRITIHYITLCCPLTFYIYIMCCILYVYIDFCKAYSYVIFVDLLLCINKSSSPKKIWNTNLFLIPNSAKFRGGCRGTAKIRQRGGCSNFLLFTR